MAQRRIILSPRSTWVMVQSPEAFSSYEIFHEQVRLGLEGGVGELGLTIVLGFTSPI